MDYTSIKNKIIDIRQSDLDRDKLKILYRELEVHNAKHFITNQQYDKTLNDVDFFIRSAIAMINHDDRNSWNIQLDAAIAILERSCKRDEVV